MKIRCAWPGNDVTYIDYHDNEWGVPVHDDRALFRMLVLEGTQAGLSWITILKRRPGYDRAYDNFDPEKMAVWPDKKIEKLLGDPGIIRNRLKVTAARTNARAYLRLVGEEGSFSSFLWSFVGGKPLVNSWKSLSEIPAVTSESDAMSKALRKREFRFVGPTICYAFMQAVGMVNDHVTSCYRYREIKKAAG